MTRRVALVGIYHESNTFLSKPTTWEDFDNGHLLYGDGIRQEYSSAFHEMGGILEEFDSSGMRIIPLFFAEAVPGGMIDKLTYERLVGQLLAQLDDPTNWDGIMVCAHGAAVAEGYPDMDGDWLGKIREAVGAEIPIVATIDPHANISEKMVESTEALVAYSTNPHLDQLETGRKAARLMVDHLDGKVKLTQSLCRPRVSISIEQQATAEYPCRFLYEQADDYMKQAGVLSVSVVLGFPYADVEKMGSSFIVIADGSQARATEIAGSLGQFLEDHRHQFVGDRISPKDALDRVMGMELPALLLDMGDNIGGGSPGDGTVLLRALDEDRFLKFFMTIYDPGAVVQCAKSGRGRKLSLTIGGKTDTLHGSPCRLDVQVIAITDGVFTEMEARHGGQVHYDMGRIAIVETVNGSTLMLTSRRTPPFSLKQLTTFGIDPLQYDVVVAKGVHAPVAAYAPVCPSIIRVNTPGITCADVTKLDYKNRRKPMFPFENF